MQHKTRNCAQQANHSSISASFAHICTHWRHAQWHFRLYTQFTKYYGTEQNTDSSTGCYWHGAQTRLHTCKVHISNTVQDSSRWNTTGQSTRCRQLTGRGQLTGCGQPTGRGQLSGRGQPTWHVWAEMVLIVLSQGRQRWLLAPVFVLWVALFIGWRRWLHLFA